MAVTWQSVPIIKNAVGGYTDQAQAATFWLPALDFLRPIAQRAPNFRVEVVATWGHSEAYVLPKSGIPLAGGWYRQNAYRPQDLPTYHGGPVTASLYRDWLRAEGVRYVLLPRDELDPAARAEAKLLEQGVPGLTLVPSSSPLLKIYELHDATPILTPPPGAPASATARTRILRMTSDTISLYAPVAGVYSLRVTYTHYWQVDDPTAACVERGPGVMSQLRVTEPGPVRLHVSVSFEGAVTSGPAPACISPSALPPELTRAEVLLAPRRSGGAASRARARPAGGRAGHDRLAGAARRSRRAPGLGQRRGRRHRLRGGLRRPALGERAALRTSAWTAAGRRRSSRR